MGFEFVIDEAYEIHRDPGGHNHHWTMFTGRVENGVIRRGDLILIPDKGYVGTPGTVLFFDAFRDNPGEITSETREGYGIFVGFPAPLKRNLLLPGTAVDCSEELRQSILLSFLEKNPERIFHGQGPTLPNRICQDCMMAIPRVTAAIPLLEELTRDGDPWLAQYAAVALNHYFPLQDVPEFSGDERAPWWRFWRKR